MLLLQRRIEPQESADADLPLPFELRQKSRLRTRLATGEEVGLFLERGTVLRHGDWLQGADGRVVRIVAAAEELMELRAADARSLARAAYHLGNRHMAVEVGDGRLRFAADDVLAEMLLGMGFTVTRLSAPFEPEPGAYAGGHHPHSGDAKHAGIIHDFAQRTTRP